MKYYDENTQDITNLLQEGATSGEEIILPKGIFKVTKTIILSDNCKISGSGKLETTLVLGDAVNNNMFTNQNYNDGNDNIELRNLIILGNHTEQFKPKTEKRLSFCNAVYLAKCTNATFVDLEIRNILQSALHFRECYNVKILRFRAEALGWSGISTSGTDNIFATNFYIYNSGNDHRHSAVHLDGGNGSFLKGKIKKCIGNGVMLDSTFSDFSNSVVQVDCSECMRGISLIGSDKSQPHSVSINQSTVHNNNIGIMVSNSKAAFINNVLIDSNKEVGILFQGRVGGCDSFVSDCTFLNNAANIKEVHNSQNNYFINNTFVEKPKES